MLLSLLAFAHNWMNFETQILAEETKKIEFQVINHGIYEENIEEPIILPGETQGTWIHAKNGKVSWKLSVEGELSTIQSVELYQGEELLQALEIKKEYMIPIEDLEYIGNYRLVATGFEGEVSEAAQFVQIDRKAPILGNVTYMPEGTAVKIGDTSYRFYGMESSAQIEILESNFLKDSEMEKYFPNYSGNGLMKGWIYHRENKKAEATICFPQQQNEETEYFYTIFYKDFSGNLMEGQVPFVCTNGSYSSERIVVDQKPPILKKFAVESGDDVKITVVIDDHPTYFQKEAVLLECSMDGTSWKAIEVNNVWENSEREHRVIYEFEGAQNEEATYQFRVSYADRANNPMVLAKEMTTKVKEMEGGIYTALQKVIIDHKAPRLSHIQFDTPVQMFDGETLDSQGWLTKVISNSQTKLYYDKNAMIRFSLEDEYLKLSDIAIQVYRREHKAADWEQWEEKIETTETKTGYDLQITLPEQDGEYYVTLSCADFSGNQMMYAPEITDSNLGEAYSRGIVEGIYQTPVFVKDSVAPICTVFYEKEPQEYNSVEKMKTILTLTEKNLDLDSLDVSITAKDINGNQVSIKKEDNYIYDAKAQKLTIELSTEAYYHIKVKVIDKVKKEAEYQKSYCIDRSAPEITVVTKDGQEFTNAVNISSGILKENEGDVTYSVVNNGWFARIINKITFGYFAQAQILVHVRVHDLFSGVKSFHPTCISGGKVINEYRILEKKSVEGDKSTMLYVIGLPAEFKGTVRMHGVDYAGNKGKDAGGIGMITETEAQHKKHAKTEMEVLTPFNKTPNYYSGNVKLKFFAEDKVSGFYEVNYLAGELQEKVTYPEGEEICREVTKIYTITDNENNIKVGLEFLDNAGYLEILAKEKLPIIHIDKTKPKIDVVYDNVDVENEKYYKGERTATITITERNFDPNDTKVDISGPSVNLSSWKHIGGKGCKGDSENVDTHHVDACKWVATAHFSKDGEYALSCKTTDLAGNTAAYGQTDVFVIDKTLPEISVTYDNHNARNGNYYNAPRIAAVKILEHNFEKSDVKITLRAKNGEETISIPQISGWIQDGDIHCTNIFFDYDGEFFFDISYSDLAGNMAEEYSADEFVVDLTAPKIQFFDIQHQSSNNGAVAPRIWCTDSHYDPKGMAIKLSGSKNGLVNMPVIRNVLEKGMELKFQDFEWIPETDDIYTMQVLVSDFAGNISEEIIRFSVNRFGSVYTFDEKTEALVGLHGSYYTNQAQELVIFETNADTLEFQKITLNCNGKLRTLVRQNDYQVFENGSEKEWKQYIYRIAAKNFVEEGIYMMTIYSEDRANNISDNHSKGKKIEFVIDKTAPSILINGVENKKQYREKYREVTVDVEDNVAVRELEITINGAVTRYDALEIAKVDGKVTFPVESSNDWQKMKVTAYDAAGNKTKSDEVKFLITANLFVQFYRNQPLFYGTIGAIGIMGGLLWIFIEKKKREYISS